MADIIFQNQLNLIIQIVILLIFLTAILVKLRKRPLLHGRLMLIAFALNTISILFIMGPLLLGALPFLSTNTQSLGIFLIAHHLIGFVAYLLSFFLVARFAYAKLTLKLCRGKWLMRATALLWGTALLMGLYLYAVGYFI